MDWWAALGFSVVSYFGIHTPGNRQSLFFKVVKPFFIAALYCGSAYTGTLHQCVHLF